MQLYGEGIATISPRRQLLALRASMEGWGLQAQAHDRHAALRELFVDAAELAQGLIDADFERTGKDAMTPFHQAALAPVMRVAEILHASCENQAPLDMAPALAAFDSLDALPLPQSIHCRRPEGYAFYALYPEAYLAAASKLRDAGPLVVIGIRSIGLGLAALVAAAVGAPPPITLRPIGHPFDRRLALEESLIAELLRHRADARFVIVDEGPGLSGSSFAAVCEFLVGQGIPEARIHLLPSHAGEPGAKAGPARRAQWHRLARHTTPFEELFIDGADKARRLDHWFRDIVGPPLLPLEDISAGEWRRRREPDWPPAHPQMERRKYVLRTRSGTWLLKFSGLDRQSRGKLARAQALHANGFGVEPLAVRHGFILERWIEGARPLGASLLSRETLISHVAAYLAFRRRHFPADVAPAASPSVLADMLVHNASVALGEEITAPLRSLCDHNHPLGRSIRPIASDNRLHSWEWLETPEGALLKTDAVDHCCGHDLIGCQDVCWDIAGATAEFNLSTDERAALARQIEILSGEPVDRRLLAFLLPCYLAFQLGYYTMASETVTASTDGDRLRCQADVYKTQLHRVMADIL